MILPSACLNKQHLSCQRCGLSGSICSSKTLIYCSSLVVTSCANYPLLCTLTLPWGVDLNHPVTTGQLLPLLFSLEHHCCLLSTNSKMNCVHWRQFLEVPCVVSSSASPLSYPWGIMKCILLFTERCWSQLGPPSQVLISTNKAYLIWKWHSFLE